MGQPIEDTAKTAVGASVPVTGTGPQAVQPPSAVELQAQAMQARADLPPLPVNEGPGAKSEYFGAEVNAAPPKVAAAMTPAEELIKAMHLFIEAQTEYIHKPDLAAMATAQEEYITAQTRYIARNLSK